MIYITDSSKQVVMVKLRNMLMEAQIAEMFDNVNTLSAFTAESIKAATIYVTILPILFAYPFAQRYFISGLTTGAVKG
jgi:putative aldouronate transport system permease protein